MSQTIHEKWRRTKAKQCGSKRKNSDCICSWKYKLDSYQFISSKWNNILLGCAIRGEERGGDRFAFIVPQVFTVINTNHKSSQILNTGPLICPLGVEKWLRVCRAALPQKNMKESACRNLSACYCWVSLRFFLAPLCLIFVSGTDRAGFV